MLNRAFLLVVMVARSLNDAALRPGGLGKSATVTPHGMKEQCCNKILGFLWSMSRMEMD